MRLEYVCKVDRYNYTTNYNRHTNEEFIEYTWNDFCGAI